MGHVLRDLNKTSVFLVRFTSPASWSLPTPHPLGVTPTLLQRSDPLTTTISDDRFKSLAHHPTLNPNATNHRTIRTGISSPCNYPVGFASSLLRSRSKPLNGVFLSLQRREKLNGCFRIEDKTFPANLLQRMPQRIATRIGNSTR